MKMGTRKECVRGVLANLVQIEGESVERYFKRTRQLCSEGDHYGEEDMRWVVKAFINGLVDDQLHSAMRAAKRRNRSMTLAQAYEELRCLRSPGNVANSSCISGPQVAAKAENSVDELSTITLFPVSYMSPDILSDPVAFSQFFINHRARPFYQSSGPFSRQSIQELHAACCKPPQAKCEENAGVANAGPAETVLATMEDNQTNEDSEKPESHFEITAVASAIPLVLEDNNCRVLPYGHDLSVPGDPEAVSETRAIESGTCGVTLRAAGCSLGVSRNASEHKNAYRNITGEKEVEKWREKNPLQHGIDWHEYVRVGGIGREEKRDNGKGDGQNEIDEGKGFSTMNLGAKMDGCTQNLIDSGWKPDVGEAAGQLDAEWANSLAMPVERESWAEEKHETAEEPDTGYQPTSSNDFTGKAIRNLGFKHIRTASEWDPGPDKSKCTVPDMEESKARYASTSDEPQSVEWRGTEPDARDMNRIVVKTLSREPAHPVVEFLWPPEDRITQAHHALIRSIFTWNTCVRKHCLSSRRPSRQAAGIGTSSRGNGGSISDNRRRFTQVAAKTGTGHSAPDTTAHALYIWKTGQALRGGINGKRIWDPGGGRAESLFTAGRRRERRKRGAG